MSDSELAVVVAPQTFPTPILIERGGPSTRKKFFEFFTVPIRNANTRAAYYRAIQQFLVWAEGAGYQQLEDPGITNFLENDGTLQAAQRIAGHADSRTTKLYDRR